MTYRRKHSFVVTWLLHRLPTSANELASLAMMHDFLWNNRDELIARCKAKVQLRPHRAATEEQLKNGVPLVLEQLTRTLFAESQDHEGASLRISGPSGGAALSEISVGAASHGKALLELGFTVDQVVHDYGDLCQAITELAIERDAPFAVDEFRTLNRCLDNAIATSVMEFSAQRDMTMARRFTSEANEKLGHLVHELRNALQTANLSVRALELGGLTITGATGAVLKRSLASMRVLVDSSLAEVRARRSDPVPSTIFSLAGLIDDAKAAALLEADVRGRLLQVVAVDPVLRIDANRDLLLGALGNLLSNAFKFTHAHSTVSLHAHLVDDRVLIEVADECGGIPPATMERMFVPFAQAHSDRSGLGLGLPIARANVEAMGGTLSVTNMPGIGCVFTIGLANSTLERRGEGPDKPSD